MHFSIIIPVYNVEPYLRQCLDSVLKQNYSDYEMICINDGSTDNCLSILQEYKERDGRIKIIDQDNHGLSAARNAGMKAASGEYILLLDSDDWLEPEALQTLTSGQKGEDMICFNGKRHFEDGRKESPDQGITEEKLTGWDYYNKYALVPRKFHFVCTVLRLYRRVFLLQNNLFFKEGILHEDNLFTPLACYYAQSVRVIPEILYVYRIRTGSIMQTPDIKHLHDTILVANQLAAFFIPIQTIDKKNLYREIAGEYFKWFIPEHQVSYKISVMKLKGLINWKYFKEVSVYPRHKRIYTLLTIHPFLFHLYYRIEYLFNRHYTH
jgi:glycosyltransferase involved in cell wall biosynthesis